MNSNWTIKNSPFEMLGEAFKILFPNVEYEAYITPDVPKNKKGKSCYGVTNFGEDGNITIYINSEIPISKAAEVFAHELAHAGVGIGNRHGKEWKKAYDNLYVVFCDIGYTLFAKQIVSTMGIPTSGITISADKSFSMEIEPPECLDINQKEGDSKNGN